MSNIELATMLGLIVDRYFRGTSMEAQRVEEFLRECEKIDADPARLRRFIEREIFVVRMRWTPIEIPARNSEGAADLFGAEALAHFEVRVAQCGDPMLKARYAEMAAANSSDSRPFARQAVRAYRAAFPVMLRNKIPHAASGTICHAATICVQLGLADEYAELLEEAIRFIDENLALPKPPNVVLQLALRLPEAGETRLPYLAIADRLLEVARARRGAEPVPDATGGNAFKGLLELVIRSKDRTRIAAVAEEHFRALIHDAVRLVETNTHGAAPSFAIGWLGQAKDIMDRHGHLFTSEVRNELHRLSRSALGRISEVRNARPATGMAEVDIPVGAEIQDALNQVLRHCIEGVAGAPTQWPVHTVTAVRSLLEFAVVAAEGERRHESPFRGLVQFERVQDRHIVIRDSESPQAFDSRWFRVAMEDFAPPIFQRVLSIAWCEDAMTLEAIIAPFGGTGLLQNESDFPVLVSACSSLADHRLVAGVQEWSLISERLLTSAISILGGGNMRLDADQNGTQEIPFDQKVGEFESLIQPHVPEAATLGRFLRYVFSWRDHGGLNLRNRVAHGTLDARAVSMTNLLTAYFACVLIARAICFATPENAGDAIS